MVEVINNAESMINFFEFATEIDPMYIKAIKVHANVKDPNHERKRKEWIELYKNMFNKTTN